MTTMKLYDAVAALDLVTEWLIESEGEMTDAIAELLETAGHDFADKVEQVAGKVKELDAVASAQAEEADRMRTRSARTAKAADSLSRYLKLNLERAGTKKVEGLRYTVSLANNAPSLAGTLDADALTSVALMRPEWVRTIPEKVELDRRAVLAAAKTGASLPEGLAVVQTSSLRIR